MTPTDQNQVNFDLSDAATALRAFANGPARQAADEVGASFEQAGERIARALGRAASRGEVSFKRLAKVILEEFAKIAMDRIFTNSGGGKSKFYGARAAGGAVNAGGAYLVGERGPELFSPRSGGVVSPLAGGVSVHFHLSGGADAAGVARHQGQIAAAIARAVAYGRRNL